MALRRSLNEVPGTRQEPRARLIFCRRGKLRYMNRYVEKLHRIASGPERTIIGLMSGTSMDGLDIALCRFRGSGTDTEAEILEFTTIPFEEHVKDEVRKVFALRTIDFQHLTLLNAWIGDLHGRLVLQALDSW